MMFLRLGWIVGQAGVVYSTLLITLANVVTLITTLSFSAICTNGEVLGGGVYFLISRALGPAVGGVIGVLFFAATAVATAMYATGFAETVVNMYTGGSKRPEDFFTGDEVNDTRVISILTLFSLLLIARVGVSWYAKCQTALLIILVWAIAAVAAGSFSANSPDLEDNAEAGFPGFGFTFEGGSEGRTEYLTQKALLDDKERSPWEAQWSVDTVTGVQHSFSSVFAVFFPAVS